MQSEVSWGLRLIPAVCWHPHQRPAELPIPMIFRSSQDLPPELHLAVTMYKTTPPSQWMVTRHTTNNYTHSIWEICPRMLNIGRCKTPRGPERSLNLLYWSIPVRGSNSQRCLNWSIFWQKEGRVRFCSDAGSTGSLAGLVVETRKTCQWVLDLFWCRYFSFGFFWFLTSKCYFTLVVGGGELGTLHFKKSHHHSRP